jgi:hypothetical protein
MNTLKRKKSSDEKNDILPPLKKTKYKDNNLDDKIISIIPHHRTLKRKRPINKFFPDKKRRIMRKKTVKSRLDSYNTGNYYIGYKSDFTILAAFLIYLSEKYNKYAKIVIRSLMQCKDCFGLTFFNSPPVNSPHFISDPNIVAEACLDCIRNAYAENKKVVCFPLTLYGSDNSSHMNALIYRINKTKPTDQLEWYEPHGNKILISDVMNKTLEDANKFMVILVEKIQQYLSSIDISKTITYHNPSQICPIISGTQTREHFTIKENELADKTGSGRCQIWSFLFMEIAITNPRVSGKRIIKMILPDANSGVKLDYHSISSEILNKFNSILFHHFGISLKDISDKNPKYYSFKAKIDNIIEKINRKEDISSSLFKNLSTGSYNSDSQKE